VSPREASLLAYVADTESSIDASLFWFRVFDVVQELAVTFFEKRRYPCFAGDRRPSDAPTSVLRGRFVEQLAIVSQSTS
jgi:hypothetical protein